ncbi:hypothetical protein [Actinocatenispora comari]|uniref:Uncharacterized protein n=1 Tax=Actinocatenispora comari TaxID=2807577 RepID=A0A8J4AIF7_9ACTN|nr:hypothetical protein [Actinocatenispora comari]GIL31324.1 hypothetical protein NUM_65780 [Actinocatenispora comari]
MTGAIGSDDAVRALDARLRAHASAADEVHDPIEYPTAPVANPQFAAAVRAVARLERSTIPRLRRMLVSPTHLDARLTAFFSTWAYERYWIADRLDQLGAAHAGDGTAGIPADGAEPPVDRAALRRDRRERVWLLGTAIATNLVGPPMVAVHVLQCLVDEWVLDEVYAALTAEVPDDRSAEVVADIRRVKAEHAEILRLAFALRLPERGNGRRLVALALRRIGWPADAGLGAAHLRALRRLVRGDPGSLSRITERINALGLGGYRVALLAPRRSTVLRIRRVK